MALSDARGDPLALGNGGRHPLATNGHAPSSAAGQQDALAAAGDAGDARDDGDEASKVQQRTHAVQRANRPSPNGNAVRQNGSPRSLAVSSSSSSSSSPPALTDSQRPAGRHLSSGPSPSLQAPPLSCQRCLLQSAAPCCPCGQPECPLFQNAGAGPPGSGSAPHPGAAPSCPCCLSACAYSHAPHAPHPASPLCLQQQQQQQHQQRWQEHLHNQAAGIR
ncbi:hypothetical protein EYF80_064468 [Liparis tanakae]|uniref:Uncharacterized protein n=1 Tax=Liparis tanakae TaxID=230148 RepID=A0A4Z2EA48_9TELE|nr:hypothetical protein EYF80_064468 [Liparis tanakae]